jgi:tetratricopeptide (TPR) repeat protein
MTMEEHREVQPRAVRQANDEIAQLQTTLATRFLLIFVIPLLVIVVLGGYAYRLSGRVQTLEALQQITFIERILLNTHNHAWAIREYERLAGQYPDAQVYVRLGQLYLQRGQSGDDKRALDKLEQARALQPDYLEIYSTAAYIYLRQHNVTAAIAAGEKALALNAFDAQTYNNLAWIYATDEQVMNLSKAQEYAVKAVEYTLPPDPDYIDTLVEVYTQTGQFDRAIVTIQDAIAREVVGEERFQGRLDSLLTQARTE